MESDRWTTRKSSLKSERLTCPMISRYGVSYGISKTGNHASLLRLASRQAPA